MTAYDKARAFILRNARPLDLAIFRYYFENGLREDVTEALAAYQNPDGGFGHGLEADNFNPDSLPMGAWKATEYIRKIGGLEAEHPVIQGILRYLDSGKDFDVIHNQWLNVVPSSNDYPCAVWWKYPEEGSRFEYNPTAALAGFTVKYAEPGSALHQKGVRIVREAADWFIQDAPVERHVSPCTIIVRKPERCPLTGRRCLLSWMRSLTGLSAATYHSGVRICRDRPLFLPRVRAGFIMKVWKNCAGLNVNTSKTPSFRTALFRFRGHGATSIRNGKSLKTGVRRSLRLIICCF